MDNFRQPLYPLCIIDRKCATLVISQSTKVCKFQNVTSKRYAISNRIVWTEPKTLREKSYSIPHYPIENVTFVVCLRACMCVNHFTLNGRKAEKTIPFSLLCENQKHTIVGWPLCYTQMYYRITCRRVVKMCWHILIRWSLIYMYIKWIQKQISNLIWSASYVNVVASHWSNRKRKHKMVAGSQ